MSGSEPCSECDQGECQNCFGKRVLRERDEARAEAAGLRSLLAAQDTIIAETRTPAEDRISALEMELVIAQEAAYRRGAEAMREAAAKMVEEANPRVPLAFIAIDIRHRLDVTEKREEP